MAGLNHTAIAQQLDTNLEGAVGGSILEATEELPVRVRISNSNRSNLEQINSLDLVAGDNNSNGNRGRIPLSAISQVKLVPKTATLTRRDGERVNTVQGFVKAGILPSKVLHDFQQRLETDNFVLPPGYYWEFGGEFADRNQAVGNLTGIVTMLLIVMIATLVLTFNSFRLATIIALVGISSVGLSLASLWLFNYPLGFMAILGTVGLVGVAINDSIVMLSALQANPQVRQGDRKAILNVIIHSTRHILTTTITTMAGFIPLLIDGGTFWPPLAICVAGGISGATLLALFFVPCLYILVNDFKHPRSRSRIVRTKLFNKKGVHLWREKRHQSPNEGSSQLGVRS